MSKPRLWMIFTAVIFPLCAIAAAVSWTYVTASTNARADERYRQELSDLRARLQTMQDQNRQLTERVENLNTRLEERVAPVAPIPVDQSAGSEETEPLGVEAFAAAYRASRTESKQADSIIRLKRITADGEQVELSDGSIWEPMPSEKSRAAKWKVGTRIASTFTGQGPWEYRLLNKSLGETVDASLKSPAE